METRGGKILKVLIFSKMVARAWNFYTTLFIFFLSCKIARLYNLLPPHPRFNSLSIRFMLHCFQSAFSPLEDLPIREFAVLEGKTSMSEFPPASSAVSSRAFALWLFEFRALRKGPFPECYRVSGISVEQVEIASLLFVPFVHCSTYWSRINES